jgi:uracil-DNA glycosylase
MIKKGLGQGENKMDPQRIDFLRSVRSLLLYHQTLGVDVYPANTTLLNFLETANTSVEASTAFTETLRTQAAPVERFPLELTSVTTHDIVDEVSSCTSCILHTRRLLPVPGAGSERPRLLVVGGWLVGTEGIGIPPGCILGPEEDVMISRMLSAMMLPPEQAFITNVIKCAIPDTSQPSAENIHTCFSFLLRQIIALNPEIICTMGIVAARALMKTSQPLSQLRGKFYPFVISDQKTVPVIPTYHPTFLLKNPEFKRATWEDLQSIAKLLKTM